MLYNINFLGFLLITVSFLFGIKLPDWDFKLRLRHRNVLTHSPFITIIFIALYETKRSYFFKYFIVGFSTAMAIHILFDLFPRKWYGGALLKIPFNNISCSEETTKTFFIITSLVSVFLAIFYMTDIKEYYFVLIYAIVTFIKKRKYENAFIKPAIIFSILYVFLGIFKFETLLISIKKLVMLG
ncbi:hypothetical protein OCK72_07175 [Fusobacterium simiae]|uniref:Metal-dependent hydrolase n=1 Tax=Fusobacterium simiae TaxID=855 RepID=A0ABT4DIK6_FUSSI|nr:hypothetical protein [Fusobacterium simiae]MCY7008437.1 hypothetical protein [Fusobacterium simiae]